MNAIDWDNLPESTLPTDINVSLMNCPTSEQDAQRLGYAVLACLRTIGSFINLSTLAGVTVGWDYEAALASVDRGMNGLAPLTRSNTTEIQGVAMSPAVIRDGQVRTHLVFSAGVIAPLADEKVSPEDVALAISIVAHESAHVQITAQKERLIPEARLGTVVQGYEHAVMFKIAEVCWDEYAACRISGLFSPGQNQMHAITLNDIVRVARERANEAIKRYRTHADINRLVSEAGTELCTPIKTAAYLLGGMDAAGVDWTHFRELRETVVQEGYAELIDELHDDLKTLWESQDEWRPDLATFALLENLAKRVFCSGGIYFHTSEEGQCRINVPFTLWTMPFD